MTASREPTERDLLAQAFLEEDLVRCYASRPPYAPALYRSLLAKVAGRRRALDLGCGTGKIARVLADHFRQVVALDSSAAMLAAGQEADAGRHGNIVWTRARAEDYEWASRFDLVAAGSSIHWLEHSRVFPKLAECTKALAVVTGDEPTPPPCGEEAWVAFLRPWLARMATRTPGIRREYDAAAFATEATRHEAWMDIRGRERFPFSFQQSLADFIESQHSRATWSRAAMGDALAARFDQDLEELMRPYVADGVIRFQLVSVLTWGSPRKTPREA